MVKLENDEENIGYVPIEQKSSPPPSPKENGEIESPETHADKQVYELFLKVSGDDQEVDWQELKNILDSSFLAELRAGKQAANNVSATPVNTTQLGAGNNNNNNGIVTTILSLICGVLCKDSPFAEFVSPTQEYPLQSFFESSERGFSKDICRSMIAMLDSDRSGKLGFDEFKILWKNIINWKTVFLKFDKDYSGTFTGFELGDALKSAGYQLNNHILNTLMHRFGNKRGEINFEDFIMCSVKVKTMIDLFKNETKGKEEKIISFTLEEWVETTVYS